MFKEHWVWKSETFKLYSRVLWIFLPNVIKLDRYNFELFRFKRGRFWDTVYVRISRVCLKLKTHRKSLFSGEFFLTTLEGHMSWWHQAENILGYNNCTAVSLLCTTPLLRYLWSRCHHHAVCQYRWRSAQASRRLVVTLPWDRTSRWLTPVVAGSNYTGTAFSTRSAASPSVTHSGSLV